MAIANQERNEVPFKCTIISACAKLGESKPNGNCKELNYISYSGADPKWDIREWNEDHSKMSKGVTLNDEELFDLYAAIGELMKHEKPSKSGPSRPKNAVNPWPNNKKAASNADSDSDTDSETDFESESQDKESQEGSTPF